jgi:hypothetical protein
LIQYSPSGNKQRFEQNTNIDYDSNMVHINHYVIVK